MVDFITLKDFQPESAKKVYDALVAAKTAFDKEEDCLYVLDTNALLKTYSFDSDSFNKLKQFFESNKGKIFATHTVEIEYIRNRESIGNSYAVVSKKKFVDAFNKIGGTIESLYSDPGFNYSYLMKDNKELCEKIKALHDNYKEVSNDVAKYEKNISEDNAETFKMDCFKMIVDNVDFTTSLTKDQYDCLKKEFEELFKKSKDKNNKEFLPIFPGRGEKKQINEYGDYLIFHELLEMAKNKKKNIILLTNDVAKNDWVDKSGKTFESYQIMFYAITGHSFIVHKYDDFLKDKIGIEAQVLEESEDRDKQSSNEDASISSVMYFFNLYENLENMIMAFTDKIGARPFSTPTMFFRHYKSYFNNDLLEKIKYIITCRTALLIHNNLPFFDSENIDLDRAIGYIKELLIALPTILEKISRIESFLQIRRKTENGAFS